VSAGTVQTTVSAPTEPRPRKTRPDPQLALQLQLDKANQLACALAEKEILLREMHHRVKNNLLAVESLVKMRMRRLPNGPAREAMSDTAQRINAVARAHEKLYCTEGMEEISLRSYVEDVARQLFGACSGTKDRITLKLDVDDIELGLDKTVKIGLLLSELLSNSLKHAFPDQRGGEVVVSLHRDGTGALLVVADNGVGISKSGRSMTGPTLGLKLATSLARQIGSDIVIDSNSGTRFSMRIPQL
jgi:two-component sensor histidine kinase